MSFSGWLRKAFSRARTIKRQPTHRPQLEALEDRTVPTLVANGLFPADNPWNAIIANAPVSASSATLVSSIGASNPLHPDFGTTWAGALNGIPINVVSGTQPRVNVVIDAYPAESDLVPIPIPANATFQGDPWTSAQNTGDRHMIVYDRDNNIGYELWHARRPSENADNQWHADGEAVWDYSKNSFRTPGFTSADAAGLPILPGLVRPDEVLDQGVINHALRFTAVATRNLWVAPASHEAGVNDPTLPRMGERFRLKQNVDVSHFSKANQVILQALKTYGMIMADNGGNWFVSGAPSPRWSDDDLHNLTTLTGSDFEAVDLTPVVSGLSATGGPTAGAFSITITGQNFSGGAGQTRVLFGNVAAQTIKIVSDTQIVVTVPKGTAGTVDVTVQSIYGTSTRRAADRFAYGGIGIKTGPTTNQRYIAQVYLDLLKRPIDSSGLAAWSSLLDQGVSRSTVVQGVVGSVEYRQNIVQALYQKVLSRSADSSGIDCWTRYLGAGGTDEQLESLLYGSDEFFAQSGASTTGFVQGLYGSLLSRTAVEGEVQGWASAMGEGSSRGGVAMGFIASRERYTTIVQGWYSSYLHRAADSAGASNFVGALQAGTRDETVILGLLSSDEYYAGV